MVRKPCSSLGHTKRVYYITYIQINKADVETIYAKLEKLLNA